jgi:hypothetical protein
MIQSTMTKIKKNDMIDFFFLCTNTYSIRLLERKEIIRLMKYAHRDIRKNVENDLSMQWNG